MALETQIDKINCDDNSVVYTGLEGCTLDVDLVRVLEFTEKGKVQTWEDNLDNVLDAQVSGEVTIISEIDTFTQVETANTYETSEGTNKDTLLQKLPYKFEATFKNNGIKFRQQLLKLDGKRLDVKFHDAAGNKFFAQNKQGGVKGFGTFLIAIEPYNIKGTTSAMYKMVIQLAGHKEFDDMHYIHNSQLDYNAEQDLRGVNEVILTASPLAATETTLTVKATLNDMDTFVAGLLTANFIVKQDGVVVAHTDAVANAVTKTYALTIPAATAGTYTVELNGVVKTLLNILYGGLEDSVVVS